MTTKIKKVRRARDYEHRKNRGWYCMHRGWQDHPVFGNEPFTNREVWEWLIAEAGYSQRLANINGKPLLIMRSQLSHSVRFMAENWGWDDSRVWRFLQKLQNWDMIKTSSETGQMVITICNYEKYQCDPELTETVIETPESQKQEVSTTKNKKDNKDNKILEHSLALSLEESTSISPIRTDKAYEPWQRVIRETVGEAAYHSWINGLTLNDDGYLYAPTEFIKDWCQSHYEKHLKKAFSATGKEFKGLKLAIDRQAAE